MLAIILGFRFDWHENVRCDFGREWDGIAAARRVHERVVINTWIKGTVEEYCKPGVGELGEVEGLDGTRNWQF